MEQASQPGLASTSAPNLKSTGSATSVTEHERRGLDLTEQELRHTYQPLPFFTESLHCPSPKSVSIRRIACERCEWLRRSLGGGCIWGKTSTTVIYSAEDKALRR
jgi:hypothetical protein